MKSGGLILATLCTALLAPAQEPVSAQEPVPVPAPAPAPAPATPSVLLAPLQGSPRLRASANTNVHTALKRALQSHQLHVLTRDETSGEPLITCQTPECVEYTLDVANAELAIVPAIWSHHTGSQELTLTLVRRSKRSLNASGMVEGNLATVADQLVTHLLAESGRPVPASAPASVPAPVPVPASVPVPVPAPVSLPPAAPAPQTDTPRRPHAWMAGPAVLVAGGAAAYVAIGVGAATKNDDQQMNTSAVAAWAALGAAAIGGGVAWWVVGAKRRRAKRESAGPLAPELALFPTKIDLRLRF